MTYKDVIPWVISILLLLLNIMSYAHTNDRERKDEIQKDDHKFDGIKESLLKVNMKLDQVCSTTNETRSDIKSMNREIKEMDTRVVVLERDMKTAFNNIEELKEKVDKL